MQRIALRMGHWLRDHIVEREETWHYEGGKRDLRLDLLRGFAAFAMITDHIGGSNSWLHTITGGDRFVVSAAEVYVFISGAVMGIVYHNTFIRQGLGAALMKAFHRAWQLYLVTIVLTFSFAYIGYAFDLWWKPNTESGLGTYILEIVSFHRTMYLTDIPMMYTVLLLAAGPVLVLMAQGFTRIALLGSFAIWLLWQVSPENAAIPWQIEGNTVFNIAAWQVLFVSGLAIGWHRARLEVLLSHLARPVVFVSLTLVSLTIAGLYIAQLTVLDSLRDDPDVVRFFFDKANVPAGRLVAFALLAVVAFLLTTLLWEPIKRVSGWLLMPLGQNSLTAYSIHIYVVAVVAKLEPEILGVHFSDVLPTTGIQLAGVTFVWMVVFLEPRGKARLQRWQARMRHTQVSLDVDGTQVRGSAS